jgi:hypothetical protein
VLREVALAPLQETAAQIERDIALLPTSARLTGL